ncbi:MAG: hypothetical protein PHR53_02540 [Bacteroidales bacterium]|nr:hypothetical protein [Bacteroidales bacterium]
MEKFEINKRVMQLIDYYTNGNQTKFAEKINCSPQVVNRLFNIDKRHGKYTLVSSEVLQKISLMCENLNCHWLLSGEGEMLRSTASESVSEAEKDGYKKQLRDKEYIIELQREKIARMEAELCKIKKQLQTAVVGSVVVG